ncbi:MAG: hypothetical protein ACI9JN_001736 [Bacteroidia bacterium]|jgi:hypothetical protein
MKPFKLSFLKIGIAVAFSQIPIMAQSQGNTLSVGSQSNGLGQMRLGLDDVWSVYNNPTDMAQDSNYHIGLATSKPYGLSGLHSASISGSIRIKTITLGGFFNYFGYHISNQKTVGLASSILLSDHTNVGISMLLFNTTIQGYDRRNQPSFSIGIKHKLTGKTTIRFLAFNPVISPEQSRIKSHYYGGVSTQITSETLWLNQLDMSMTDPVSFSSGILYDLKPNIRLTIGIRTTPRLLSFGVIVKSNRFHIGSSFHHHQTLGLSPTFSAEWSS